MIRLFAAMFLLSAALSAQSDSGSKICSGCHAGVFRSYRNTGMAHSFFRPAPANTIEDYTTRNQFFHLASDTHYEMLERDGKYFQRRYQIGYDGKQANVDELSVDYVMGSGAHARTFLHRTAQGTLVQLPLGWYSEKGGYWAMSPGYDTPNHPDSQRAIGYDCMFCHNAYPNVTASSRDRFGDLPRFPADLPEGVDCQRCHGPAQKHIAAAQVPGANLRGTILNPARLSLDRQAEVCLQCHLQPNSLRPTHDFKRYGKEWFSYNPAEPLPTFMTFFDTPDAQRFQIAGSAYRLRQSACFLKSAGALQCTTCHNPHEDQHGKEDTYTKACLKCHTNLSASADHKSKQDCVGCHMPPRRTQDVVHVVMTDHRIQRRPEAGYLAERPEVHDLAPAAPARPYYPPTASRLELAIAQVRDGANTKAGLPELLRLLKAEPPTIPDPFFEAAEAQRSLGNLKEAAALYQQALARDPKYPAALLALGTADALRRGTLATPDDARMWTALGTVESSKASLQKALALDPGSPAPHVSLGILLAQAGSVREAEAEFREAIRLQPTLGEPHGYLANILIAEGDPNQAIWEFERAARLAPQAIAFRLRYAGLLYTLNQTVAAMQQADAALQTQPASAEAHHLRGNILEKLGRVKEALAEYKEAVRLQPKLSRAQLDLGAVLADTGDKAGAIVHLKLAALSEEDTVRRIALQSLAELGVR